LLILPSSLDAGTSVSLVAAGGNLAPVPDASDDIYRALKELQRELEDAEEASGGGSMPGNAELGLYLDNAEAIIDQFFDPYQDPSLDPVDAGSIDPTYSPVTLSEFAATCVALAEDAVEEGELGGAADHDEIGSQLKTIESLLPGYRLSAGL